MEDRLYKKLEAYGKSDFYPFHMPGHKRNPLAVEGDFPVERDITEIDGFDNLHHATGIIRDCAKEAARLYGADEAFLLVNGSSAGIMAAICGAAKAGDNVIVARNVHRSVINSLYLGQLNPVYIYPDMINREAGIYGEVKAEEIEAILKDRKNNDIKAVIITSPTYDGIVSDQNGSPVYEDGSAIEFSEDGDVVYHYLDENGNLEYIVQAYIADDGDTILGKTLDVKFENLGFLYKTDFTDDVDGIWEFEIKLPEVSSAKHFDLNKKVGETDFTVTDVEISPISMEVNYTVDAQPEMSEDEIGVPEVMGVTLKDGTSIPYLTDGGRVGYIDDTHAHNVLGYDRVVDVDQIQSLLIMVEPGEELVSVDIQ